MPIRSSALRAALVHLFPPVVAFWLFSELVWYSVYKVILFRSQKFIPFPPFPAHRRRRWFDRMFIEFGKATRGGTEKDGLKEWMTGWNGGASYTSMKLGNVQDFLSGAFFHRLYRQLSEEDAQEIDGYVAKIEELLQYNFEPGRGPLTVTVEEGRNNDDDEFPNSPVFAEESKSLEKRVIMTERLYSYRNRVRAWYRPLGLYILIALLKQFVSYYMRFNGFKREFIGNIRFWHRIPSQKDLKPPIVFFHGIAPGLFPYLSLLSKLWKSREIFIVELPWVSMHPFSEVPNADDFCHDVDLMLANHHHEAAVFVGHSYGSFVCKWMHLRYPRLFAGLVLLDPVSILIYAPYVTANFIFSLATRKSFARTSSRKGILNTIPFSMHLLSILLFQFFAAREISIARTITRHIIWYNDNFFADELPQHTSVVVSSKDFIVPASKIIRYLENFNSNGKDPEKRIFIECLEGMPHAGMLLFPTQNARVAEIILSRH